MPKPKSEVKALRERMAKRLKERYTFDAKHAWRDKDNFMKRSLVVERYQRKIFGKALTKLGLSLEDFEKRQQADHEAATKHRERQMEELRRHAAKIAKHLEKRRRKAQTYRRRFENERGNPTLNVFLCQATSASGSSLVIFEKGNGASVSPMEIIQDKPGENIMRIRVAANSSGTNWSQADVILWQDFVWDCDLNGSMNTEAFVDIIGAYDIDLVGRCIGNSVSRLIVSTSLSISQNLGGSTDLNWSGQEVTLLDIERSAGCVGVVDSGEMTRFTPPEITLSNTDFQVRPGPVLVTVSLYIQVFGGNGADTVIDLMSDPNFGFDVPCVALFVET